MKKVLLIGILSALFISYKAQTLVGESFTSQWGLGFENVPLTKVLPNFENLPTQNTVDGKRMGPLIIGQAEELMQNPAHYGSWMDLGNGYELWRMQYISENATFLSFLLQNITLKEGAQIDLFSDESYFGGIDHQFDGFPNLLTSQLKGSKVTIEFLKKISDTESGFTIEKLYSGIPDTLTYDNTTFDINDSQDCEYDADCAFGDDLEDQKKSLVLFAFDTPSGLGECSGALINNTAEDRTPYVLTAYHCFHLGGLNVNPGQILPVNLKINYRASNPACPGNNNVVVNTADLYTYSGNLEMKSQYQYSDFALMEMDNPIDPNWDVYFSGWDRSLNVSNSAKSLHYPNADVMKVSVDEDALISTMVYFGYNIEAWKIGNWEYGATEGGSSGAPLFNTNQLIVGQLIGGSSACQGNGNNGASDYYGRLNESWNGNQTSISSLNGFLDPLNTGQMTLQGLSNLHLSVDDVDNEIFTFQISPNPVKESIQFQWDYENEFLTIVIHNAAGQLMYEGLQTQHQSWDSSFLEKGVYFVQFLDKGTLLQTHKFIKE